MTQEDQIFIVDVVVTDLTQQIVVSNVTNWPIGVAVKFITIIKIHKYKRF
jgi:hypothetical protein